ncbi:MAG: enolase C-terminal domain-like protein [archaeon]
MVVIKEVSAKAILDSRKEKTILISIKTDVGNFSASAPTGKSTGKHEVNPYKKNLDTDIQTIKKFSDYFSDAIIEKFEDLRRIEDTVEGHVGANTLFALESATLKALAKEQDKEVWQLINPQAKSFPRLVGNCIGGGKHSQLISGKKPDFQEFLLIPDIKSVKESFEINQKAKKQVEQSLKERDGKFKSKRNDEDAWMTSLNEKEILEILKEINLPLGLDVAASSFYKRKKYYYQNPMLKRDQEEQIGYLKNLIKNFDIFYIEDPFGEEDFEAFSKLTKKFPNSLVVGDDLTVTSHKKLLQAIKSKSISAIIVKPNQCGSLLEVKRVCDLAKENSIKIVFSHRSGETQEDILADLAFGFQADFFKCGITGKEREVKLKRLVDIENSLK